MSDLIDEGIDDFLVERANRLELSENPLLKANLTFLPYKRQVLKGAVKKEQFTVSFIFPFPDTLGTPFPVPVLVTSIRANGSTLNYLYLVIYLLNAPDEFSPITCHCKPSQKQFGFQYGRSLFFRVGAFADSCAFGSLDEIHCDCS